MTLVLIIGGALAVIMLVVGIVVSVTSERSLVEERLGRYVEDPRPTREERQVQAPVTEWLNKRVAGSSFGDNISREFARADIKAESRRVHRDDDYLRVYCVGVVGLLPQRSAAFWRPWPGSRLASSSPASTSRPADHAAWFSFNEQLADMLNLMVNGLRAGYSTMQAMEAVSKELPAPICDEFRRVVQEMQLGRAHARPPWIIYCAASPVMTSTW